MVEKDKNGGVKWTERKHGVWRVRGVRCYGGYGNDDRRGCEGGGAGVMESRWEKGEEVKVKEMEMESRGIGVVKVVKENRVGDFELAWDSESAGRGHALT